MIVVIVKLLVYLYTIQIIFNLYSKTGVGKQAGGVNQYWL